jgi:hypothetical protein
LYDNAFKVFDFAFGSFICMTQNEIAS